MKKHFQNDRGYSLLIAIGAILIFTVLGLSLMTLTTSGIVKNQTRENIVQATDLADKGTDFAINDIQKTLEGYIKEGNVTKTSFETFLINVLSNPTLKCSEEILDLSKDTGYKIPAENNGTTKVCIENVEEIKTNGTTEEKDKYKRIVTFKSIGFVNNKHHISTSKAIIGTDTIPDQLKYAISTNNEGNLYLHGGIEIQGDIKTDGNLILSPRATWQSHTLDRQGNIISTTTYWPNSVFTKVIPGPGSSTAKIIFSRENKAAYELKHFNNYEEHISGSKLNNIQRYSKYDPSNMQDRNTLSQKFFNSSNVSVLNKTTLPQDNIEITKTITDMYKLPTNKINHLDNLTIYSTDDPTSSYEKTDTIFVSDTEQRKVRETYTYKEKVCIKYDWVWWPPKLECVKWEEQIKTGIREVNKDHYKFGKMNIDGKDGSNPNKSITLKGTYFVYGDLIIKDVNLKSDAIIYVEGSVKITNSTLQGVDNESTLIVFSNGNIDISNMSVDSTKNDASKIKGFFYTKQNMIMYGVGSNINLFGGISAHRLILTAVRGDSTKNNFLSDAAQSELEHGVAKQYSRLKIIYDQKLISTYTQFDRDKEEEFITQLNDPEIIERE